MQVIANRKEVKTMKYAKPEVAPLASAIQAVESPTSNKSNPKIADSHFTAGTSSAYEADE